MTKPKSVQHALKLIRAIGRDVRDYDLRDSDARRAGERLLQLAAYIEKHAQAKP